MTGWIRDRLFDAATDWLLSGGWVSVVLAIAAAALIWVAIEKAAEQFMTPLLMTAVLMAFAAVFAPAGERRRRPARLPSSSSVRRCPRSRCRQSICRASARRSAIS